MKSRQLGFVLMALIAVGVAGLLFRVIAWRLGRKLSWRES